MRVSCWAAVVNARVAARGENNAGDVIDEGIYSDDHTAEAARPSRSCGEGVARADVRGDLLPAYCLVVVGHGGLGLMGVAHYPPSPARRIVLHCML